MGAPSTAFVQQFTDTIAMLSQQFDNRLRGSVMVDTNWTGEKKFYDQYGEDEFEEIISRLQDTPVQDADHQRRMVTPRYFVSNTLEDPFEALQMLVDPKSTYMQAKQAAMGRKVDNLIAVALGGTAYSGKTGTTSNTLGAAQKTSEDAAGLTLAKLVEGKEILDSAEVDKEDRTFVHASDQMSDLLNVTTNTSIDYNSVKALVQGDIDTWVGFKFVHSEQLESSSSYRHCYAFQKKGVQLAIQKEAEGRLTERPDKNYAWQVFMRIALGVVRLEEKRVVQIPCYES